ncbi:MAG TPA: 2-dehydropantoate 2-reductase [Dehalococcoidia bacterium]|nr:2-dehydropantoate 2-reductase [Dehalococcoidia bacterium]
MRIAIYGAGAIGAYLGAHLAAAGEEVTLIARGAHLEAMREHGLRLIEGGREQSYRLPVTDDPASAGPQDCVVLALKAHQVASALGGIREMLGPETPVVTAQNGIPWWYFYRLEGPFRDRRLDSVDPGGKIWAAIGPERAIGCVVYPACEVVAPGVVRHIEGDRFSLGEPDGSRSGRLEAIARAMVRGGLKAPQRPRIRNEIWLKLWGNVAFNPLSALTRATLADICRDPFTRRYARDVMLEVQAVARALGEEMPVDVDQRIRGAEAVGAHKTSMLQDLEQGRPLEVDALVGAVVEIARLTGTETPHLDALFGMVRLMERSLSR